MSEFLSFLQKNIELSIAFGVIVLLLIWEEFFSKRNISAGISPQNLVDLMNHKNALILDVRTTEAFKKGHIIHAMNIPAQTFETQLKKLIKYKASPVVLVNEKGQDTAPLISKLKENGFQNVLALSGGLAAWNEAGLPLTDTSHR